MKAALLRAAHYHFCRARVFLQRPEKPCSLSPEIAHQIFKADYTQSHTGGGGREKTPPSKLFIALIKEPKRFRKSKAGGGRAETPAVPALAGFEVGAAALLSQLEAQVGSPCAGRAARGCCRSSSPAGCSGLLPQDGDWGWAGGARLLREVLGGKRRGWSVCVRAGVSSWAGSDQPECECAAVSVSVQL